MAKEADVWRAKAVDALERAEQYLSQMLRASAALVRLQACHSPDDFNHCPCCGVVWPCESAAIIQEIATTTLMLPGGKETQRGADPR